MHLVHTPVFNKERKENKMRYGEARETIWRCSYRGSDPKEYLYYGLNYYLEIGCNKEAFHWIRKSAEGGHKEAYGWLSVFYYHGYGGNKDYVKAMYWGERGYTYLHRDPTGCSVSDIVKLAHKKLKQQQLQKEKKMNSKELTKEIEALEIEIEAINEQKQDAVARVKRYKNLLPKAKEAEKKAKRKALEQEHSDAVKKIKEIEAVLNK